MQFLFCLAWHPHSKLHLHTRIYVCPVALGKPMPKQPQYEAHDQLLLNEEQLGQTMGGACIPDCLPPCLPACLPPCLPASCFPPCLPAWEVRPRAAAMMHLSMDINRHTGLKVCGLKLHAPRIANMGCNYHGTPYCITLFTTNLYNDLI